MVVKEFYPNGTIKFLAEVDGKRVLSLRYFDTNAQPLPCNPDDYEFFHHVIVLKQKPTTLGYGQGSNIAWNVPPDGVAINSTSHIVFNTGQNRVDVDELVLRTQVMSAALERAHAAIDRLNDVLNLRAKNKTTISIDGSIITIGREINRPVPPEPAGWHRVVRIWLNPKAAGGIKNMIWIKGVWEKGR